MTVRCKFVCRNVSYDESGGKVLMEPVTGGSEENAEFFRYTPYGKLEIGTINMAAMEQFIPGNKYYIDISEAL